MRKEQSRILNRNRLNEVLFHASQAAVSQNADKQALVVAEPNIPSRLHHVEYHLI